jgi:2-methylisocitrate lyase-like PEP mutase family enzyme
VSRTIAQKRADFRALHQSGCFVLPNPWDAGSARYLASLGFKALATTSAGFAWSLGVADNHVRREEILAHLSQMVAATDLPINADFENGFGATPEEVGESVALAVATGVAGLSIEDASNDPAQPIFPLDVAVARIAAARRAIDQNGGDTLLVGRAENFLNGISDIDDTVKRLKAYADAGADCLFAPGLKTREQIKAVVQAVAPKPVNVVIASVAAMTLEEAAALGVRRISTGGAAARAAWTGFMTAAQGLAAGHLDAFASAVSGASMNALFSSRDVQR